MSTSLFDRIDSITDPDRPRLSHREKMATLFGCVAAFGFMMITSVLQTDQPPVWIAVGGGSVLILLAVYSLLFVVPTEENNNET